MSQTFTRPPVESAAAQRGRLKSDTAGEFHFEETSDYLSFVRGQLRQSRMKYKDVVKGADEIKSTSTVSNLASGKTQFPRFSTMTGIMGSLGLELVIRGRGPKQ